MSHEIKVGSIQDLSNTIIALRKVEKRIFLDLDPK